MNNFGHHKLHNRYIFKGQLKLVTGLCLSSGRASNETDAPLMRQGVGEDGKPIIPGSSLRGAIRSELERILAGVGKDTSGIESCVLFTPESCDEKFREYKRSREREDGDLDDEKIMAFVLGGSHGHTGICDLCKLFGTSFYASKLVIEDAVVESVYKPRVRDCVGIDRDTGAARDGVKFDYEVLEVDDNIAVTFKFKMMVENMTAQDKTILQLMDSLLREGIYVGGKRAGGLGMIQQVNTLEITGFQSAAKLWERLQGGVSAKIHDSISSWEEVMPC